MSQPNKVSPTLWSQSQAAEAAEMWQLRFADHFGDEPFAPHLTKQRFRVLHEIARAIGKGFDAVEYRLETRGASFGTNQLSSGKVPAHRLEEAAARREASYRASLTGQIFGDPPPGYSALDKREGLRR